MSTAVRVALFIDAENASAEHFPVYLEYCRKWGKPTIARCYGGATGIKRWEKVMADHYILPMLTPPSANKENASDFALTIDAVSLLHRDQFDHAVIASSDADFIQLAIHIREHGKGVCGIGRNKAPDGLRNAFDDYKVVDEKTVKPTPARKSVSHKDAPQATAPKKPATGSGVARVTNVEDIDTEKLMAIYRELADGDKPVTLTLFGKELSERMPGQKKSHGTWKNVLKKSGRFNIDDGSNGVVRLI